MSTQAKLLVTGGTGRLGRALRPLLPEGLYLSSRDLDITDGDAVARLVENCRPDVILHAAAYTDVARAEVERERCWQVNVQGTRHVAQAAQQSGAKLLYISTDYVFAGDQGEGGYQESDPPGPPVNYYGLTKLVAEAAALQVGGAVIRTSFRLRPFPHPLAVTDGFTSQDYLEVIAPELALAVRHAAALEGVLHIASQRRSVYELAQLSRPGVQAITRADLATPIPRDVSLDSSRWQALSAPWRTP